MHLISRLNPVMGLIIGITLGGVTGLLLDNFALWLVIGASVGLLMGQYCRNRVKKNNREVSD
ncbi:MAG: hypothetical protein ABIJ47_06645 [Candidatus Bathyarchaeota archaeon]